MSTEEGGVMKKFIMILAILIMVPIAMAIYSPLISAFEGGVHDGMSNQNQEQVNAVFNTVSSELAAPNQTGK
jgi:hypothetical protein